VRAGAAGLLRPSIVGAVAGLGVVWLGGLAYLSAQQVQIWQSTESLWRYALESDPDCAICHGNLGVYLSNQGNLGLAKAEFDQVLALRPDNVKVHQHIGYVHATLGNFPKAIEHFNIYLKRYPHDVDALNNLGAALLGDRRPKDALLPLQHSMKVKPRHVLSHVNMGFAYADLNELPRARQLFQEGIALKYDTPQAWFGLARVCLQAGDVRTAQTAWGILGMFDTKLAGRIGPAFTQTW